MRRLCPGVAIGVMLTIVGTFAHPAEAESVEFMADRVTQVGDRTYRASLFCREDRCRIEHNDTGSVDVTIVRKDKGLMWLLVARMKQFKTLPLDSDAGRLLLPTLGEEIARDTIGTEVLDGHPTTVSQITAKEGDRHRVYYQWWAEDMQLPLRIARQDGTWIVQYKNIKLRQLSPHMFELPLHYRPVDP